MNSGPDSIPEGTAASTEPDSPQIQIERWTRIRRIANRRRIVGALVFLAAIFAIFWYYRITRPDYRLARGQEAVRERDWEEAEELIKRLEADGRKDHAHLLRAEFLYARKQTEEALAECNQIKDEKLIRQRAAMLSGRCLLDLGAYYEAGRAFVYVLSTNSDDIDAYRGMATVSYELGQMDHAVAHLEQVIRLDPTDARPHRLLGDIFRDSGGAERAIIAYREALRLKSGLSDNAVEEVRFELAIELIYRGQHAEALEVLDAGPSREPQPHELAVRAEALRGVGRRPEAMALVDRALASSNDGAFHRLKGQMLLEDGKAQEAVALLELAVKQNPHNHQSHVLLAQAYAAIGRKADAERINSRADEIARDYTTATALNREAIEKPWDPLIRLRLAEHFERTGDSKSAAMWRKAAAELQRKKD